MARLSILGFLLASLAVLGLAAYIQDPSVGETESTPRALVAVMVVRPETVTLVDELPARVTAYRTAEIRPQVGGIIQKRFFQQGSEVKAGQPLFEINPDPFKAEIASAAATVQRAKAKLVRAQAKFARTKRLLLTNAVSQAAYDDATADLEDAKAGVGEAQAAHDRRRLDLEFATVRAPIDGRIGPELVSEGALVSASGANPLAVIHQIDKVYVDVRQPTAQIDVIRAAAQSGQIETAEKVPVAILSASGQAYPVSGRALFSDISVDPGTGNVTVRVEVANPDRLLLPGMYVRARLPRGIRDDALLVPEETVVRDPAGKPQIIVIDKSGMPERRTVLLGETIGRRIIVRSGLKPGETVAVQGQERVLDGVPVETVSFSVANADVKN